MEERAEQTFSVGLYELAAEATKRALEIVQERYGEQSQQVAKFAGNLGALYNLLGREKEAKQLLSRARRIRGGSGVPLGLQTEAFFERVGWQKGGRALPTRWPTPAERLDQLVKQLNDANPYIRNEAVVKLATLSTIDGLDLNRDRALHALEGLLVDRDEQVRLSAADALSKSDSEAALKALRGLADHEDSEVRRTVMVSIGKIGSPVSQKVAPTTNPSTPADPTLGHVVNMLTKAMADDPVGSVRSAAAWSLLMMDAYRREGVPVVFIRGLSDHHQFVRLYSAYALRKVLAERTSELGVDEQSAIASALEAYQSERHYALSALEKVAPEEQARPENLWRLFQAEYFEKYFEDETSPTNRASHFRLKPIDMEFREATSQLISKWLPGYRMYVNSVYHTFIVRPDGRISLLAEREFWPFGRKDFAASFDRVNVASLLQERSVAIPDETTAIEIAQLRAILTGNGYYDDDSLQSWVFRPSREGNTWTVRLFQRSVADASVQTGVPPPPVIIVLDDQGLLQDISQR